MVGVAELLRRDERVVAVVAATTENGAPEVFEVEVVRVVDEPEPATGDRQQATGNERATGSVRSAAGMGGRVPEGVETGRPENGRPETAPRGPGSPYMHMRGPEFRLSDEGADAIFDHPLGPPPQVPRSGKLENAPGGRAAIHDPVAEIEVERDGTVHVNRTPDIDIHLDLPLPSLSALRDPEKALRGTLKEIGKGISDWYDDPYKEERKPAPADMPDHLKAVPGQCDEVGALNCEPEPMPQPHGIKIASGKMDLTAYLARKFGVGDVYSSRKRALLDATIAERADRGGTFRGEQLARSAEIMRVNLERMWAVTPEAAARREALFTMWDECAEGDGPLGEAGERARIVVIGWIVAHLPRGSAGAYSEADIARLSVGRASKQAFDPYAAVVDRGGDGSAGSAR